MKIFLLISLILLVGVLPLSLQEENFVPHHFKQKNAKLIQKTNLKKESFPTIPHSLNPWLKNQESVQQFSSQQKVEVNESPDDFDQIESLCSEETLAVLQKVLDQVWLDLEDGVFGDPERLNYHLVFQFWQNLHSFKSYLQAPEHGPEFNLYYGNQSHFLGRYFPSLQMIELAGQKLSSKEGDFLIVLFHEYSHYQFHQLNYAYSSDKVAADFFNELSAYVYSSLLLGYLSEDRLTLNAVTNLHLIPYLYIRWKQPQTAFRFLLHYMKKVSLNSSSYSWMKDVTLGDISEESLLEAIEDDFTLR